MKHCLLGLCLAFSAVVAQAGVPIQHWNTPNGTRVLLVENHDIPMLDVQVDFAAGTARDPAGQTGVAEMTLSLLDAGVGLLEALGQVLRVVRLDRVAAVGEGLQGGVGLEALRRERILRDRAVAGGELRRQQALELQLLDELRVVLDEEGELLDALSGVGVCPSLGDPHIRQRDQDQHGRHQNGNQLRPHLQILQHREPRVSRFTTVVAPRRSVANVRTGRRVPYQSTSGASF